MLRPVEWIRWVVLPLLAVIVVDQASKAWAEQASFPQDFGMLTLTLHYNQGFMLGALRHASKFLTMAIPAAVGSVVIYIFLLTQYFLPIRSIAIRVGSSLYAGGVLSNIVDRMRLGMVVDFLELKTPFFRTGIFNVADTLQVIGVATFLLAFWNAGNILFPKEERRGRKWIDPSFQGKFCAVLVAIGGLFCAAFILTAFGFLRAAETQDTAQSFEGAIGAFALVFGCLSLILLMTLAFAGLILSHRIIGPVRKFEGFLESLLKGEAKNFRLRQRDHFVEFEQLADRYFEFFHERLGLTPPGLEPGRAAPTFAGTTFKGETVKIEDFSGSRLWLIFYRYATCPLCILHLSEIKDLIQDAKARGVAVVAVFESTAKQFLKPDLGRSVEVIQSLGVPLIADPERAIYRRYRARARWTAVLRFSVLRRLIEARRQKFFQGSIDGKLGQLPAHFFIDAQQNLALSYYGDDLNDHVPRDHIREFIAGSSKELATEGA